MSPTTKHKALLLGEHETILGIATEPAVLDPEKPICLVLNAGIIHRIGAHRNAVNIARALAEAGFLVVRLDLSGIGDSPRRRDALDFGASAVADVREVMDHLSSLYATPRFVAIGLCSGADNAFQTAIVDDRLVGAVFLDGYAYPTNAFRLRDLARRARAQRDAATLVRKVAGNVVERAITLGQERLPQLFGAPSSESPPSGPPPAVPDYVREFPPRDEVAPQLKALVGRDFRMLWLYTGGVLSYFNHEGQFRDSFPDVDFRECLDVVYVENSNHTATALRSQRQIRDAITAWASRRF
ncbi:MAG: alpha/beta hydrolase [Polyangiaceae bacterium]